MIAGQQQDVLGLAESLFEPDGPFDLPRQKLAWEPQIHGGKKTRVVIYKGGIGGVVEEKERRGDG